MSHGLSNIVGVAAVDRGGMVSHATGGFSDRRIASMIRDHEWLAAAADRRLTTVTLTDASYTALTTQHEDGYLILLFAAPGDTVAQFLMSVDFAWDILEHILTDPYDAMVVVDASERVNFISPVHERFFGLRPGEAVGRKVREVIANSRLHHVVRTGVAEVGQILKVKDGQRVVSRHPIRHNGQIAGAIGRVMFKGPEQLEALNRHIKSLEQTIARYQAEAEAENRSEQYLDAIIGNSVAIESVRQQLRRIAPLDVPVLIQGESGTGKELVARALHMLSARHTRRLVTVNAAALPANLVESELFGYEAGSFTGADRKGRPGKFEQADGGTIFLDEIGDMPLEVQSKLLRVLQDRVVERVGGDRPKSVDFRLCSATNHNLQELVDDGRFRLDLFYRISPVQIIVPPLSERLEDIPLLLRHFSQEFAEKYNLSIPEIDRDLPDYLMSRQWPGNIRQLRHEIERAIVFSERGRLTVGNFGKIAAEVPVRSAPPAPQFASAGSASGNQGSLKDAIEGLENKLIADALARFKGNKKQVAAHLGISRSYLYKKLNEISPGEHSED